MSWENLNFNESNAILLINSHIYMYKYTEDVEN